MENTQATTEEEPVVDLLPPYKQVEHYSRYLQSHKKSWAPMASCWDLEVSAMYPRSNVQELGVASTVCTTCPTVKQCLRLALVNREEYGVWGGYSAREIQAVTKDIISEYGNIWVQWNDRSEYIISETIDLLHNSFIEKNGINENEISNIEINRVEKIEARLAELKL